ncbi:MarR family winged helix-turn-helix transcriptional regulator [Ferrimicrobium acidiphilum]|jgi:DNA-binding MarR family transcriptional regulator|uniref:MarR family protein n=1 Tax=Ferrimicrobium acidiphilum DSM 19497 TaxID=1121877 RepID=A0A0D8FYL0_9ACTN|nr:helix-turn-helix domain-containing protein [Ferrimicrobium acidiphilum]KJE78179.1 MarR family protein [Ferrimicrobium acidiphilum DSM 19497]
MTEITNANLQEVSTARCISTGQLTDAVSLILAMMPIVRTIKARAGSCQMHGMSITPRHMQALMQILLVGRVTVSELADQLRLSLASISLIVSQLAIAGLLERHEDPLDHRRTVVGPGPEYDRFVVEVLGERFQPLIHALATLSSEDRETLDRLAHLLSSKLVETLDG